MNLAMNLEVAGSARALRARRSRIGQGCAGAKFEHETLYRWRKEARARHEFVNAQKPPVSDRERRGA